MTEPTAQHPTRRDVLAASAALGAASVLTTSTAIRANSPHGSDVIRMGLIGCGGRGVGALVNALEADAQTVVTAVADVFDRQASAVTKKIAKYGDRVKITPERTFAGLEAYRQLVACDDVDYVLIATPGKFHSHFLEAAIDAGKHVFCEKPGAADVVGLKQLMRATEKAKQKGLGIMCGLQRRHSPARQQLIDRLQQGEMGAMVAASAWWNRTSWQYHPRREGETDLG